MTSWRCHKVSEVDKVIHCETNLQIWPAKYCSTAPNVLSREFDETPTQGLVVTDNILFDPLVSANDCQTGQSSILPLCGRSFLIENMKLPL